jgi:hypothetical protein
VSWHGAFLNWFYAIALFTYFLQLFSMQSQLHVVFYAIAVTMLFLQLFFCNHTAIRLQSHCDKVANTHMLVFATAFFLQSQHISSCNHTLTDFAITRIFSPGCNHIKQTPT